MAQRLWAMNCLQLLIPVALACHRPPPTQPGCWVPRGKPERDQASRQVRSDAGGLGKPSEVGDGETPFPLVSPVPPGFHRIVESLRLEKTSKIIKSNCQPITTVS